ncbi:MAG: hypothetical protein ACOC44_02380 [Promethearchaeia archaeon]
MKQEEFEEELYKAQNYMQEEEYQKALSLLYRLREIEKKGNFNNALTHKLYQLISNSESLHNQKTIITVINNIKKKQDKIKLDALKALINEREDIDLKEEILGREIEILILRGVLPAKIEEDYLLFA